MWLRLPFPAYRLANVLGGQRDIEQGKVFDFKDFVGEMLEEKIRRGQFGCRDHQTRLRMDLRYSQIVQTPDQGLSQ